MPAFYRISYSYAPDALDIADGDPVPAYANPGQINPPNRVVGAGRRRECRRCDVTWRGEQPCWSCGKDNVPNPPPVQPARSA